MFKMCRPSIKRDRLMMPSKIWLKCQPHVQLCKLLGSWTPSKRLSTSLPNVAKQAPQATGELDALQDLVEVLANSQTLADAKQLDAFYAPVELAQASNSACCCVIGIPLS